MSILHTKRDICYLGKEQQNSAVPNALPKYQYTVNKNPTDATVCRYLFTKKLLYMFRVSQHPSSGVLKTVPAASGTDPDQTTLEGSSGTSSMTCTGGCWYSF